MGINIRPAKHGGEWDGRVGGGEGAPYRHFGVAVATWVATRHLPCQSDIHEAMAAVSGHGSPIGALQRRNSLNRDIIVLAKSRPVNIGQQRYSAGIGLYCSYRLVQ